jgi:hypothetical protein
VAKAKFEAVHRTPEDVERARVEAAQGLLDWYFEQLRAGFEAGPEGGTSGLIERCIRAERALRGRGVPDEALCERAFEVMGQIRAIAQARFEAGRDNDEGQMAAASYALADVQLRWLEALAAGTPVRPRAAISFEEDGWDDPLEGERQRARAKRAALQATPEALQRVRREAARSATAFARERMLSGKDRREALLDWSPRLLAAERAALGDKGDLTALRKAHWRRLRDLERLQAARYAAGMLSLEDYLLARYDLLDAELAWIQMRVKRKPR